MKKTKQGRERMMKQLIKKFWPLLCLLVLVLVAGGVFLLMGSESTPEKAVAGFLTASLEYDEDDLLEYASDYQRVELAGNVEMDGETLEQYLQTSYAQARELMEGEIPTVTVDVDSVDTLAMGTERYEELLAEYGEKADAKAVEAMAVVRGTYRTDDDPKNSFCALAVQCGGKWYYGFRIFDTK